MNPTKNTSWVLTHPILLSHTKNIENCSICCYTHFSVALNPSITACPVVDPNASPHLRRFGRTPPLREALSIFPLRARIFSNPIPDRERIGFWCLWCANFSFSQQDSARFCMALHGFAWLPQLSSRLLDGSMDLCTVNVSGRSWTYRRKYSGTNSTNASQELNVVGCKGNDMVLRLHPLSLAIDLVSFIYSIGSIPNE